MRRTISIIGGMLMAGAALLHAEPERERGINLYQMPESAAHPDDAVKRKPGFMIRFSPNLEAEHQEPFLETAGELKAFAMRQSEDVRNNGIWIVVPAPEKTTENEKRTLSEIREAFRKGGIPLFICEATKLPDGWIRWDETGG